MSRCVVYQSGGFTNYGISYRKYSQEELEERTMENPVGAYALYMFLKGLIEDGGIKRKQRQFGDILCRRRRSYTWDNRLFF